MQEERKKMIKKLARSIRQYKKATILSPIFVSLEVVMECIIPLIMAKFIDEISSNNLVNIAIYSVILVTMAFLSLLFGMLSGKYCAIAASGFGANLRHDVYAKVQGFSFANIDKFSTSSLVTRLTTDVTNVQMSFMMIIRIAIRSPFMLIFSIVMAFIVCPSLAWIFVVILPVLGCVLFGIIRKAMPLFNSVFKKYDNLNSSIEENIKGIRVVKSYVREDYEKEKFNKAASNVRDDFTRAEKIVALNSPAMQFAIYVMNILVTFLGASLIIKTFKGFDSEGVEMWGLLSTGQLSSLLTYGMQSLMSLMMLSMIFVMITISIESAKRVVEVLDEESSIKNPLNPVMEITNGDIEFKNVSFKYKEDAEKYALRDVNLKIKSGETIGIIGGTGSSKTTLIQLISRLYDTSVGDVYVGDVNVKDYDLKTLRDGVSVVLQKNVLFSGTIKENLRWGDENASDDEIIRACKLAQADEFIQGFNDKYDTYIEQGGTNVSGGQKQRLCIARALLKKPKVLILDDSTSAVDTKTDALIRKAFKEEIPNITKIIIAQRVSSVCDADQIIVMDNGTINQIGTHEELLKTNEIYREVYESQNRVGGNENEER